MLYAVVLLALCSLMTPAVACWTVSLNASPASFPRDNNHTSTITATVKQGGVAKSGETVSFSVAGPGTLSATSAGPTDYNGQCSITVKSSDISDSSAQITVTGTCQGASGPVNVTANGLNMTLTSQYPKIYIGNPNYHKDTILTCTVVDTTQHPAEGTVAFESNYGTVAPSSKSLNASGVATTVLTPGNYGVDDDEKAFLGPPSGSHIEKPCQVIFADQVDFECQHQPQKKVNENAIAAVKFFDQKNQYFPGCNVHFHFYIPNNITYDYTKEAPISEGFCTQAGPNPTADGYGTVDTTSRWIPPAFLCYFATEDDAVDPTKMMTVANTIGDNWKANGQNFIVNLLLSYWIDKLTHNR
jgi:hypothetical protein